MSTQAKAQAAPASAAPAPAAPRPPARGAAADPYRGRGGLYVNQGGRRVRVAAIPSTATPKEPQQ